MGVQWIGVEVDGSGSVRARRRDDDAFSDPADVCWAGLDAELVALFERWLMLRDRTWEPSEIRVFGQLLHRCLFPDLVWNWVESAIDRAQGDLVRLSLTFPADGQWSRLAAVPWEYLHTPERAGRRGDFLARRIGVVLSRYIPSSQGLGTLATTSPARLLVVVSRPDDPRLGDVDAGPVVDAIERLDGHGYQVTVCLDPTVRELDASLRRERPDLVHFVGHGAYSPDRREGSVALRDEDGNTEWISDTRLADLLRRYRTPRVVVLHACEGARTDEVATFAGVAPQLVRGGVTCVVAMQYAVTNETAIRFSTEFYEQVLDGVELDAAVQECRWRISGFDDVDARLVGVPVVYWQSRDGLLVPAADGPR